MAERRRRAEKNLMEQGYKPNGRTDVSTKKSKPVPLVWISAICLFAVGIVASVSGNEAGGIVLLLSVGVVAGIAYSRKKKKGVQKQRPSATVTKPIPPQSVPKQQIEVARTKVESKPTKPLFKVPNDIDGMVLAYKYSDVDVAGTRYAMPDFGILHIGDLLQFVPDPQNEYDPKAIRIVCNGSFIGHIHRGKLQDMLHDWFAQNMPVWGCIANLIPGEMAIKICLAFYKESEYERLKKSGKNRKVFKLTGNGNEEMQSNIWGCAQGEEVSIDYDYEKGKGLVSCVGDIGYLPETASEMIDGEYKAFIEEIGETESGKSTVKVIVFQI